MNQIVKLILLAIAIVLFILTFYFLSRDGNDEMIANIEPRNINEDNLKIIAFGDSLTAGYGLPIEESYPAQLQVTLRALGHEVEVINAGVSGETTRGNLERAKFIRAQNPDIVLLGIGGNDALRLLPVAETKKNMEQTITTLQSGDHPPVIILLTIQAPLNVGLSYKKNFDAIYEELAEKQQVLLVPFLTTEIFLNKDYKLADGIHLNKAGYKKVIDSYLLPVLEEVILKLEDN